MKQIRLKDCNKILSCGVAATPEYVDVGVPFISAQNIQNGKLDFSVLKYITEDAHKKLIQNKKVKLGDVLITRIGAKVGESCIFNLDNEVSIYVSLTHLRLKKAINNKFFTYLIKTHKFYDFVNENTISCGGVGNLNVSLLKNFTFLIPSLPQQTTIANYLDHHTAKLDKEISLLEQKVEKLDEYKQALIYETVTKGLDKNVPMKDSGIEWIGMIPKHWEVKRLKDIYSYNNGYAFSDNDYSEDLNGNYLIKITHVTEQGIKENENLCVVVTETTKNFKIKNNSTLYALSGATAGKTCFFEESKKSFYLNQRVAQIKNKKGLDKYMFYILNNKAFSYLILNLKPQTAQPNIGKDDLDNSFVPFVFNVVEQQQIIENLDKYCSKIDKKKELVYKKIELLKEYKQSLIYEAVTGKINVGE